MKNNNFIHLVGNSSFLKDEFKIHVTMPNKINNYTKVFYLFHGMGNDEFKMSSKIDLKFLCQKYNLMIITPFVDKSFTCNTLDGNNYFDFVENELLKSVKAAVNFNLDNNDRYIVGASMGAYGALKVFLNNNKKFKKIGLVSGCFDLKELDNLKRQKNYKPVEYWQQTQTEWIELFGNEFDTNNDLFIKDFSSIKAKIIIYCGNNDELLDDNKKLEKILMKNKLDYKLEINDGNHDWQYFIKYINKVIIEMVIE